MKEKVMWSHHVMWIQTSAEEEDKEERIESVDRPSAASSSVMLLQQEHNLACCFHLLPRQMLMQHSNTLNQLDHSVVAIRYEYYILSSGSYRPPNPSLIIKQWNEGL